MRPIDADLLKTRIKLKNAEDPYLIQLYEAIIKWIDIQPTIEIPPCVDCEYCSNYISKED